MEHKMAASTNFEEIENFIQSRKNILFFYSPYNFLRTVISERLFENTFQKPLCDEIKAESSPIKIIVVSIRGNSHYFCVKFLKWDTDFFKLPTYKLQAVIFNHDDPNILRQAVAEFMEKFFGQEEKRYCFMEAPSEDIAIIRAL